MGGHAARPWGRTAPGSRVRAASLDAPRADTCPHFCVLYPDGAYWRADVNEDANVGNLDMTPFLDLVGWRASDPRTRRTTAAVKSLGSF